MSTEENKALVRHVYELASRGEIVASYEFFAPKYVDHFTTGDMSLKQVKQTMAQLFAAIPDAKATIEHIVAEGDKVAWRVTWRGTHRGEYMGIAPTGKEIVLTGSNICRIVGGKLAETWVVVDSLHLYQQLGILPTPGQ